MCIRDSIGLLLLVAVGVVAVPLIVAVEEVPDAQLLLLVGLHRMELLAVLQESVHRPGSLLAHPLRRGCGFH
eukprot:7121173-Alexandrium_andersonii.AAC.1